MIINAINIINKYIIYMYNFERKYFIRHLLLLFFTRNHFPLLLCYSTAFCIYKCNELCIAFD